MNEEPTPTSATKSVALPSVSAGSGPSVTGEPSESSILPANSPDPATEIPLSPEEQMALYEKELKEQDWGHQPC